MSSVAFLGLGTMGRGMVVNLLAAGHEVVVWNRDPARAGELVEQGARAAGTIPEAVTGAEFVMVCLSDDAAVRAVVLGEGGVVDNVPGSAVVIDLSTISPALSDEERAAVEARGARFLDAPVFGSKGEAAAGGLWVVAGGDEAVFEACLPVLQPISETVHHVGPGGSGARMKLTGNLVVASQLLALGQALTLADKVGLQLDKVLDVFRVTDFRSPIFDGVGAAVLQGDYSPSFALHLMRKDLGLVQDLAVQAGAPVPSADAAVRYVDAAIDAGWADENASALIKAMAHEAGAHLPS